MSPQRVRRVRLRGRRLLFVYGTLRRGAPGIAQRIISGDGEYLDTGSLPGSLYDLGAYPGLTVPAAPADRVVGDLFALRIPRRTLTRLDAYEGSRYRRTVGVVDTPKHGRVRAWVYRYTGDIGDAVRIYGGDYLAYLHRNPAARRAARWSRMI
ncbi:MAG: gamma-glutamylcyclotransferase [Proteobacteria bacterium]|nr:gamma-glutamylcyclotransferase [Pseudomonadota bacterium]